MLEKIEDKYRYYLDVMRENVQAGELENSRKYPFPYLRAFIFLELHHDGYTYYDISSVTHRDHSTISYWITKVKDIINSQDKGYRDILKMYNQFIDGVTNTEESNDNLIIVAKLGDLRRIIEAERENGQLTAETASKLIYSIQRI